MHQPHLAIVVKESTGHYYFHVLNELYEAGIYASVVNAYLLKNRLVH
jgi:transposase